MMSKSRKKKNRLSQVGEELSGLQKENSYNVYVYEELEKAKLKAGEQEELEKNLEFMEASEEIRECISSSLSLFEAEDYPAILPNLLQVKNNLAKTAKSSEKLGELAQRSESALIELRDIYAELQHIGESLNFDPESLETVKQRLDLIYSLERKHEVQSVAELLALQEKFSETLSGEEDLQNEKAELEKELQELQEELRTLAEKIFEQRKEAAERVEQETCGLLADMGMQAAVLKIKLNKKKKGFLCLALCLILTVSFGMQGLRVNATNMSSITSDSIRDKQDQIKQAEKEREPEEKAQKVNFYECQGIVQKAD